MDYLADDFELGFRIARSGFEVVLADVVVETHLPAYTFREFFEHQLRWARSTRDSRRRGYLGLLLTFGLPWAIIAVPTGGRRLVELGRAGAGRRLAPGGRCRLA